MKQGIDVNNQRVCQPCGKQYMEEIGMPLSDSVTTAYTAVCCVCGQETTTVHERNYRYLAKWKANGDTISS